MRWIKFGCISALPLLAAFNVQAVDVELSGAIEVEAGLSNDFSNSDTSDITLATAVITLDAAINEYVAGHVSLLYEEDDTPLDVDEGMITLDIGKGWNVTAGQMYVPFGNFESNMISDPLTLEIGETRETTLQLSFESEGLYGSVYAFNGDSIETSTYNKGDDTAEHYGFSIGKVFESDNYSLNVGVDYISSIADTDGINAKLTLNQDTDGDGFADLATIDSYVGGIAVHWIYNRNALSFVAEYVKSDKFNVAELAFNGQGAEPSATNIEIGYEFDWGTTAIGYQSTDESLALGLPETRILVAVSKEIYDDTFLGFEYAKDSDYSTADGGTGNDGSKSTIQLAVSF